MTSLKKNAYVAFALLGVIWGSNFIFMKWAARQQHANVAAAGVTYIPPVVALVIGVFLAGGVILPIGYVAMVLILLGVALLPYGSRLTYARTQCDRRQ